jgi:hypothetical protein
MSEPQSPTAARLRLCGTCDYVSTGKTMCCLCGRRLVEHDECCVVRDKVWDTGDLYDETHPDD